MGGEYVRSEVSEADIENGRSFMQGILDFLDSETTVTPVAGALSLSPGEYEQLKATLGTSSGDAMLVARGSDVPLLSDDLALRVFASSTHGVDGLWTQPVLERLVRIGAMSRGEYLEALFLLLASNYRHPRVTATDLSEMLQSRNYEIMPAVGTMLGAALGPDYNESVLGVAAELIAILWRGPYSEQRAESLVAAVVGAAILPRNGRRQLLQQLAAMLQRRLTLDPLGFERLARFLQSWAVAHFVS